MQEAISYARRLLSTQTITHQGVKELLDKMLFAFETQENQLRSRLAKYDDTVRESLLQLTVRPMVSAVNIKPGALGISPRCKVPLDVRHQLIHASMYWDFDAIEFDRLSGGRGLEHMYMFFINDCSDVLDTLGLEMHRMQAFIRLIADDYRDAPYHNRAHAISVMHAMHMILQHGGVLERLTSDPGKQALYTLACLMAAAGHDAGHPGVSNTFLIDTRHRLALNWNDQSPLENMHLERLFAAIKETGMLQKLGQDAQKLVRNLLISLVLATDMKQHMVVAQQFEAMALGKCGDGDERELRVLKMCMKCADLGHTCMKWPKHMAWVTALQDELHLQGIAEMKAGCKVTALTDPAKTTLFDGQVGFFDVIVLPTYKLLVEAFPACAPLLQEASSNYSTWQQSLASSDKPVG